MPDPMPTQSKEPSAWALKAVRAWYAPAVDDSPMVRELAQIIDAAYAPLIDLIRTAAEHHEDQAQAWGGEEGDAENAKYHTERAKVFRDALGQSTAGGGK